MPEFVGRLRTPRLASAPASPVVGEVYYDTVANKLLCWDGTAWGTELKYNGSYVGSTAYKDGDVVVSNGVAYLCVRPTSAVPTGWPQQSIYPDTTGKAQNVLTVPSSGAAPIWSLPPPAFPVGAPIPWLVSAIPSGYLEFNGQAITVGAYPQLFALFGANLPDLTGRVLMGQSGSYAIGTTGGAATHTLATAEIPSHGHGVAGPDGHSWGANWNGSVFATFGFNVDVVNSNTGAYSSTLRAVETGGGGAHNNLQPYRTVRWITVAA